MAPTKKLIRKSLPVSLARTALERKCLNHGVRITYTRRVILDVLQHAKGHLTVEDIYRNATAADTNVSLSSVYSNIRKLVDTGVIEQRQFQSRQSYYSGSCSVPHDQLIDIDSGRVIEFRNAVLDKLKADIAQEHGFSIADCRVEFYGRLSEKQR